MGGLWLVVVSFANYLAVYHISGIFNTAARLSVRRVLLPNIVIHSSLMEQEFGYTLGYTHTHTHTQIQMDTRCLA